MLSIIKLVFIILTPSLSALLTFLPEREDLYMGN